MITFIFTEELVESDNSQKSIVKTAKANCSFILHITRKTRKEMPKKQQNKKA